MNKGRKTVRTFFFIFMMLVFTGVTAQEPLMPVMPEPDSAQMELERRIMYQQLLSGTLQSGGMLQIPKMPHFDFNSAFAGQYRFSPENITYSTFAFDGFMPGIYGFAPSPFFRNGAVFSSAAYRLNDKFTLGGYSFGANSVFSAPFPNQGINKFDTRGSTFFMEYKVSKNFKIETRVSVSQGPGGF
jgi:hypothetical protein